MTFAAIYSLYVNKAVDELARGKKMQSILRS
jgi:hypothetical protein